MELRLIHLFLRPSLRLFLYHIQNIRVTHPCHFIHKLRQSRNAPLLSLFSQHGNYCNIQSREFVPKEEISQGKKWSDLSGYILPIGQSVKKGSNPSSELFFKLLALLHWHAHLKNAFTEEKGC